MRRALSLLLGASVLCTFAVASGEATRQAASAAQTAPGRGSEGIPVLHVQRNVHVLPSPEGNVTVQIGSDGVLIVDTKSAAQAPAVAAAIRTLSDKPLHTIVNTHVHADHLGGNDALVKLVGVRGRSVRVIAHENVQRRLVRAAESASTPVTTLPINSEYFTPSRDFFLNGEAVVLYHMPEAHTDGDTVVFFRGSDVVSTGDLFVPDLYPIIDLENGGSVQGLVAALNKILEITVPARFQEGGTYVIPGHGRPGDEAEVVEYRDMVTIIRDRVQDLIAKGMTLEQVKAARPSRDYDTEYGGSGARAPEMFVEAVYRSLRR